VIIPNKYCRHRVTRVTATRPTVHGRYLSTPPPYLGALPCAPYCSKYQNSIFAPHIHPAASSPSPTTSCGWGAGRVVGAGGRVRAGGWIPGVCQWTDAMSAWGFTAGVRKLGSHRGGVSGTAESEVAGSCGGGIGGQAGHAQEGESAGQSSQSDISSLSSSCDDPSIDGSPARSGGNNHSAKAPPPTHVLGCQCLALQHWRKQAVKSFELLYSPAPALWHPQLRKTCSKRAFPRPRAHMRTHGESERAATHTCAARKQDSHLPDILCGLTRTRDHHIA
jgi:hypothetical protein